MRRLFLLLCLGILLSVTLAGCGGDNNIKETPYQNVPLEDIEGNDLSGASAERLYQAGHAFLAAGATDHALRIYTEIQSDYPFSRIATQAALETVTAYYIAKEYVKAVSAADRFIKQHPRHPHIDYLYYLRGLANYHRNDPGVLGGNPDQRDLSYLRQSFSDFKLLISNFPKSVYAKDAQLHMIKIRNRLAGFELSVAEYYLQRHAYVAAGRRASYIVTHYQRSEATPRALEIMQESYSQLNLPALAGDARSILQESYPDYILHRNRFYAERNNDYFGDDGLPDHDSDKLVPKPVGPIRSALQDLAPWAHDKNDKPAWYIWFKGGQPTGPALGPTYKDKEPADQKSKAPSTEDTAAPDNQAAATGSATTQAATKKSDSGDRGFFGSIWDFLTPGD